MSVATFNVSGRGTVQGTLDELGTPLHEVTFVVFDLETTGGSARRTRDHRDRRGQGAGRRAARRVRHAGRSRARRSRRSSPCSPASPTRWWRPRRRSPSVLPTFLEFIRGAALVAHNAPFDVGFLKAACAELGYPPPANPVVDTADLARRMLTRDEAPNCKLATLARISAARPSPATGRSPTPAPPWTCSTPCSSGPARSGCTRWRSSRASSARPPREQQRKRHLAEAVPQRPRRLRVRGRPRRAALRRQERQPAHPGALLFHRRRDPARASAR